MSTRLIAILLLLTASTSISRGQGDSPPAQAQLDEITRRGRLLAEYDAAAWHATDAVMALSPDKGKLGFYAAQKTERGWIVVFGRLSENKEVAIIAYEAVQGTSPNEFIVTKHEPPREDNGFFLVAARAKALALQNSLLEQRPYNVVILPAESQGVYVYVQPAQTETGVYPLGGDARFLISLDGTAILGRRQLHKSILETGRGVQATKGRRPPHSRSR